MDVKIAVITGTVFAGVLVAGAVAAPRSGGAGDSVTDPATDSATVMTVDANGALVSQTTTRRSDDDYEDEDDDDHDDDDRHERDDDGDDDDDHEDDD